MIGQSALRTGTLVLSLLVCALTGSVSSSQAQESEEIEFADEKLEQAVRDALGIQDCPICTTDMAELMFLVLTGRGIENLSGIEYCVNLTTLYLGGNAVADLRPLEALQNLEELDLCMDMYVPPEDDLTYYGPVASLPNLKKLNLSDTSDLGFLAGLSSLTELDLIYTDVEDLTPLAGLTSLTSLSVYFGQVSDLSPIAGLDKLAFLLLSHNQIADLRPLSGLTRLESLIIHDNEITDLSPLADCVSLRLLVVDNNRVAEVEALSHLFSELPFLETVCIGGNEINDISPLVDNPDVGEGVHIVLQGNPLSDEAIDEQIPALQARGVTVDFYTWRRPGG